MQFQPRHLLSRLRWYSQFGLRRLGVPGVAALGILIFCAVSYFSSILPAERELAATRGQLAARDLGVRAAVVRPRAPEEQLHSFEVRLPLKAAIPDSIGDVARIAQVGGLAIEQADYRPVREAGHSVMRYEMSFQVTDTYPKIKAFIGKLLAEIPHLAVENLSLQRQKVTDTKVEAQIHLVMYFRNAER